MFFLFVLIFLNLNSQVDSVIIYPDYAIVFRKAKVFLEKREKLTFKNLSWFLEDNSVRIRSENLKIGEVFIKKTYLEEPPLRVKELEKKIKEFEKKIQAFENEKLIIKSKEEFLLSIKLVSPEIISKELLTGKISPESWERALDFLSEKLAHLKERSLIIEDSIKEYKKQLEALKKELEDIKAMIENKKEISFELIPEKSGEYEIELSYNISNACSFIPYYEIKADENSVNLNYYVKIRQKTGEDWENTRVVLNTAKILPLVTIPELSPYYVSFETPPPMTVKAEEFLRTEKTEVPLMKEETKILETGISLEYILPTRISLKSGEEKKFFLKGLNLPAEFEYFVYPRKDNNAYLQAKIFNNSEMVFLSGEAATYIKNNYTGKTVIKTVSPKETLTIGLGIDERIKVERKLVKFFIKREGVIDRKEKQEFTYETKIENYSGKERKLKIIEQIPISQIEEIKVKLIKIDPKPDATDEDLKTFTYYKNLKPNEKFIINLSYFIEYPIDKKIIFY
ncbi:MAG: mucoidy inhibitor MuiA family protein [candidate division WOR-3 bacterium]|nr:mucoidy inhibitor MuiA family protein [candidate division WOR-3 bacterium]MCX7836782.1 mucoidy inhibitor MuiA family protein [candidate division WOR-3 bacterium]MDW8113580.1 mucoidy inhibitor MuiA family protein [candidate division WOR-3 bacterium]